jgi:5'-3' exonuclease
MLIFSFSVIVVFDGARLDDRKLATTLERSKKRVDYSTKVSVNIDLSPLLLRQTFVNVLDEMNIPYVSALGEGDDECVALANHLDCYLIARDSDYYCYNLYRGYVPFDYVDINPIEKDSYYYLSAQLFTVDSLLDRFPGLTHPTLSLACCLCGNDYITGQLVQVIFNHIVETVAKTVDKKSKKGARTTHWYAMQWMKQFDDVEMALHKSLEPIRAMSEKTKVESKLRSALQSYLNPTDTLIYRFATSRNQNLLKNAHFVQLARDYLQVLHKVMHKALIL